MTPQAMTALLEHCLDRKYVWYVRMCIYVCTYLSIYICICMYIYDDAGTILYLPTYLQRWRNGREVSIALKCPRAADRGLPAAADAAQVGR